MGSLQALTDFIHCTVCKARSENLMTLPLWVVSGCVKNFSHFSLQTLV